MRSRCVAEVAAAASRSGLRGVREIATSAQDPAALAFRRTAPHAVLDAMKERVLEALGTNGACRAHALRGLDTGPVGRKELAGIDATTTRLEHPRVFVRGLLHAHLHFNEPYGHLVPWVHIERVSV